MKVKDLQTLLSVCDPEATVVVDGYESVLGPELAEVDLVSICRSVEKLEDPVTGNRMLSDSGISSVWIGWSKDYRTEESLLETAVKGKATAPTN